MTTRAITKNPLQKKALLLEYITIIWNAIEGLASIGIGFFSGSLSLVAFGLESSIEVFSSCVTVWQLKGEDKNREKTALKLIGIAFLAVAIYVSYDAIESLFEDHRPEPTMAGIVFMTITAFTMLILGIIKRRLGKEMKNPVVIADSNFAMVDAALSSTVLVGLVINALFGWWWIDQALALFIAGTAFREGARELL